MSAVPVLAWQRELRSEFLLQKSRRFVKMTGIVYAYPGQGIEIGQGEQRSGETLFQRSAGFPSPGQQAFAKKMRLCGHEHGNQIGIAAHGLGKGRAGAVDEQGNAAGEGEIRMDGNAVAVAVTCPVQGKASD